MHIMYVCMYMCKYIKDLDIYISDPHIYGSKIKI